MDATLEQLRTDIWDMSLEMIDELGVERTIEHVYANLVDQYSDKIDDDEILDNVNDIVNNIEL